MMYLSLIFDEHFRQLATKLVDAASALWRLLHNLEPASQQDSSTRGLSGRSQICGAAGWVAALILENRARFWLSQWRILTARAVRGYRTVSTEAVCLYTGIPPWGSEVEVLAGSSSTSGWLPSRERLMASARRGTRVAVIPAGDSSWWLCHLGGDLSLMAVIRSLASSDRCFTAVITFCEGVILQKEFLFKNWNHIYVVLLSS